MHGCQVANFADVGSLHQFDRNHDAIVLAIDIGTLHTTNLFDLPKFVDVLLKQVRIKVATGSGPNTTEDIAFRQYVISRDADLFNDTCLIDDRVSGRCLRNRV